MSPNIPLFESPKKKVAESPASPAKSPMILAANFVFDWLHGDLNRANNQLKFHHWLHGDAEISAAHYSNDSDPSLPANRKLLEILEELESMQRIRDQQKNGLVKRTEQDNALARKSQELFKRWIEERGDNLGLKTGHGDHANQQEYVCNQKELLMERLLVQFRDLQRENNNLRKQHPEYQSEHTVTKGQVLAKALSQVRALQSQNEMLKGAQAALQGGRATSTLASTTTGFKSQFSSAGAAKIARMMDEVKELEARNAALKGVSKVKSSKNLQERIAAALIDEVSFHGLRGDGSRGAAVSAHPNPRAFYIQTLASKLASEGMKRSALGGSTETFSGVKGLSEQLVDVVDTDEACELLQKILDVLGEDGVGSVDLEPETSSC
jgi:hypothetical protein